MQLPDERRRLRITDQALAQAQRYARLVDQVHPGCECIGFLLGGRDDLVDSIMLAPGQTVGSASARIDAQSVLACGREMERLGKRPKGWWHSHGHMNPFHSSTDDENTAAVLLQIASSNRTQLEHPMEVRFDETSNRLCIVDDSGSVEISADAPGAPGAPGAPDALARLIEAGITAQRISPAGYAYSLVVNAHGDAPHAEVYTNTWCTCCDAPRIRQYQAPLEIVHTIATDAQLIMEIEAKVSRESIRLAVAAQDASAESTTIINAEGEVTATGNLWLRLSDVMRRIWARFAHKTAGATAVTEVTVAPAQQEGTL